MLKVKLMYRKLLCWLLAGMGSVLCSSPTMAQPVPARDLWDFPIGAIGSPAALASEAGAGLWNPARIALPESTKWRAGISALSSSADQGVESQLAGISVRRHSGTLGLSVARSSIKDLIHTDTDPQSLGTLPYESLIVSVSAARELTPWLTGGISARWRQGRAERDVNSAVAADIGIMARHKPWKDLRVALGTFLWRPGKEDDDRPILSFASDIRVWGKSELSELRLGVAAGGATHGQRYRSTREIGPFMNARLGPVEAGVSLPSIRNGPDRASRTRLSTTIHLASFAVGIGREDGSSGLGPVYQFSFSTFGK